MPNHITNVLDVTGPVDDVKKFIMIINPENNPILKKYYVEYKTHEIARLKKVLKINPKDMMAQSDLKALQSEKKGKNSALDFNGTVPMPIDLHGTTATSKPEGEEKIRQAKNVEKYGSKDWYDWSIKSWGTKWGAYDVEEPEMLDDGVRYRFQTAWSPPVAWLDKTAELFPTLKFCDSWIDEGGGAGRYSVWTEDGEVQSEEEELSEHDWKFEYDGSYKEQYEQIVNGDYDKFLAAVLESNLEDYDYDLQLEIVKRIKDNDLPLFTGMEWSRDEASELYIERLKTVKVKKPLRKIQLTGDSNA